MQLPSVHWKDRCRSAKAQRGHAQVESMHYDMEAAVEIAQLDPVLENGGTIRASQMMEMP